jgi:hypothetical protein
MGNDIAGNVIHNYIAAEQSCSQKQNCPRPVLDPFITFSYGQPTILLNVKSGSESHCCSANIKLQQRRIAVGRAVYEHYNSITIGKVPNETLEANSDIGL